MTDDATDATDRAAVVAATRADAGAETAATRADAVNATVMGRHNRTNMLWEITQAFLAVALTLAAIYASLRFADSSVFVGPNGQPVALPVPETLKNALFLVLGFYFGRTNHARPSGRDDRPL